MGATEEAQHETAAMHMVREIPVARADTTVDTVMASLRGRKFECADTVFVTDDDGRLEGIVRINDLFADSAYLIGDIMEEVHEAVRPDDDQEDIAVLAMELDMIAVPVVDDDGRLLGAVPPEALLRILRAEHMEDLQRLAGINPARPGSEVGIDAPLGNRIRRRLPWLVFGLFASSLITIVMAGFEHSLSANVAVAFFVPAIVYIAGAIGTQAVSVAVRGLLDDDVRIGKLLRGELVVGAGIGAVLGLIAAMLVMASFGDHRLAAAVGLAVLGGGVVSAVVGFGLPWAFTRFGADPALGSGPVCTIIQDVSSLLIYFTFVTLLL
ncbi:magnesium transporter [Oricola thermophila]|uniref:Magnesium transporter n=1 Tax=Oricola thermophila TaxID=2742145 RepID=A0A6N1VHM8_9HYPH|nr:magnesium transporter [Oricola thermophila]QKV18507.1 magnesium transporter [Oricola thermophila]